MFRLVRKRPRTGPSREAVGVEGEGGRWACRGDEDEACRSPIRMGGVVQVAGQGRAAFMEGRGKRAEELVAKGMERGQPRGSGRDGRTAFGREWWGWTAQLGWRVLGKLWKREEMVRAGCTRLSGCPMQWGCWKRGRPGRGTQLSWWMG